jgi:hypothetical protein
LLILGYVYIPSIPIQFLASLFISSSKLHWPRPIKSLEENLAKMDEQYESLNEHVAVGESIVDMAATDKSVPQSNKQMR